MHVLLTKVMEEQLVPRPAGWEAAGREAGHWDKAGPSGPRAGGAGQPPSHSPSQPGRAWSRHSLAMANGFSTSMVPQSTMVTSLRGLSRLSVFVFSTFRTTSWVEQSVRVGHTGRASSANPRPVPLSPEHRPLSLSHPSPCPPALCRTPRASRPATASSRW